MAGGGIVALPTAVIRCQFYPGIILLSLMAIISTFSAVMLSKCWEILLRRFPDYRTHCRKPYAEIGYRALGPIMKFLFKFKLIKYIFNFIEQLFQHVLILHNLELLQLIN
ncbi:Aa_trans domain-containing protein [Meloidogyne graminicola]|uniref:Aa_trans domain-containing protein n=1 Tax=Meloidogyne graminicola TaxID=189291 RepID=A0A8S9Z8Y2_9BILA|nr:Aa_trans domain-containing protein [Meloidogyne graminicola]